MGRKTLSIGVGVILSVCLAYGGLTLRGWYREFEARYKGWKVTPPLAHTKVFDRWSQPIAGLYTRDSDRAPLESIPEIVKDAVLAAEDRRFFSHPGVDLRAVMRALGNEIRHLRAGQRQGGSTVTQQVVRHLFLSREQTYRRKAKEICFALWFERRESKAAILEIYLNELFLGHGSYGVQSAASRYLGKSLSELNLAEAAVLASLYQSPSRLNPQRNLGQCQQRQRQVLRAMYSTGKYSRDQIHQALRHQIRLRATVPSQFSVDMGYFIDHVVQEASQILGHPVHDRGLEIHTTLDADAQRHIATMWSRELTARAGSGVEGALLVADAASGAVRAMQGGSDYNRTQFNRAVYGRRQPGSLFKIVVYAAALSAGQSWNERIWVTPQSLGDGYRPRSLERDYLKPTTLLRAFYRSMNAPTVEIGAKIGFPAVVEMARLMGISSPLKAEYGTLLGSSEITLPEVVAVLKTIATLGRGWPLYAIEKIRSQEGKLLYLHHSPPVVRSFGLQQTPIWVMMRDALHKVTELGTARAARRLSPIEIIGKTGTTNGSRDNWFGGIYGRKLVAVAWVGTEKSQTQLPGLSGTRTALPLWIEAMAGFDPKRNQLATWQTPALPTPGVKTAQMNPRTGQLVQGGGVSFLYTPAAPPVPYRELPAQASASRRRLWP